MGFSLSSKGNACQSLSQELGSEFPLVIYGEARDNVFVMNEAASVYIHDLDPFLIQFSDTFGIRWYGLAYLAGFLAGYYLIAYMAKKKTIQLPYSKVADFITFIAIGTMVGGRLGYAAFYAPELFTEWTSDFPFWGVLKVHEGGMASHGGIIGIIATCFIYGRVNKISPFHALDLTVFGGTLGVFFGRIANFINGELYGRAASEGVAWAVKFPQEMYLWARNSWDRLKEAAPAAEALGQIPAGGGRFIEVSAETWTRWVETRAHGQVRAGIEAMIHAVQTGHAEVAMVLAPVLTARHPSQIYQALMEGLLVFVVLSLMWLKPRKPGVISASFGVLYAIMRIIGEQFRMPDAHIGYEWLGLTRGQWLSVGMVAIMVVYLVYVSTRDTEKIGGWGLAAKK